MFIDDDKLDLLIAEARTSGDTACIADRDLFLLWSSDETAENNYYRLLSQLSGADTVGSQPLPLDQELLLRQTNPQTSCKITVHPCGGQSVFRFTFFAHVQSCPPIEAELYAMYQDGCQAIDRHAIAMQLLLNHFRESEQVMQDETLSQALWSLENTAFAIRNRIAHINEVQWYADMHRAGDAVFKVQSISALLRDFADGISSILKEQLIFRPFSIAPALYTQIDLGHFEFVLFSMFRLLQAQDVNLRVFSLIAYEKEDRIQIHMQFSRSGEPLSPDAFYPPLSADYSCSADEHILALFCALFHAAWETDFQESSRTGTLSLPLCEAPADAFAAEARTSFQGSFHSLYPLLLFGGFQASVLRR